MYHFKTKEKLEDFIRGNTVNTPEAIEILKCSRQNIHSLIKKGKITPIKEMARDRLFWRDDIEKWKIGMNNVAD